jgi:polysaccharide pyruvyl transferase WcaK-like protein
LIGDQSLFVPCVSCLNNSIISEPIGNKTLVFTNANEVVSPNTQTVKLDDVIVMRNNEPYESFVKKWKQCDKVITNSYHGIYWSLLSGRSVAPYGYSSKFISVMRIFNMELPKDNIYDHRAKELFIEMLKRNQKFVSSKKYNEFYKDFSDRNYEYAEKLSKIGVICKTKTM